MVRPMIVLAVCLRRFQTLAQMQLALLGCHRLGLSQGSRYHCGGYVRVVIVQDFEGVADDRNNRRGDFV